MAIEKFLEELGAPNGLEPITIEPVKLNNTAPVSKPDPEAKKRDAKLEKAIKETGEKIISLNDGIKGLRSGIDQNSFDAEATLTRLSGMEAELRNLKGIQQGMVELQTQVEEHAAIVERESGLCPNCRHDVDWPNLPPQEGFLGWIHGNLYRTCPDCGHQIRVRKEG